MRLFFVGLSLLSVGCPAPSGPSESPATTPPSASSDRGAAQPEPGRARPDLDRLDALVADLNAQCQAADDCEPAAGLAEGTVSADTTRVLEATRAELKPLGHDVVYAGHGFGLQAVVDLQTVMGGHFSVDHLGPDAVQRIEDRVRARSSMYLAVYEARFVPAGTAVAWRYDTVLLEMLRDLEHERVRSLAAGLVDECDHALANVPADADESWSARVESRRRRLSRIAAPR